MSTSVCFFTKILGVKATTGREETDREIQCAQQTNTDLMGLGAQLTIPGDDIKNWKAWGLIRKVELCPGNLVPLGCFSHPSYLKILSEGKKENAFISSFKFLL